MSNKGTFPEESALLRQFLLPEPNIISCQIDSSVVQEPGLFNTQVKSYLGILVSQAICNPIVVVSVY